MAIPGGALDRTGVGNKAREDLMDVIYNISPTERPFQMVIGRSTANQDAHEWATDALAAARSDNKHVDGDDFFGEGQAGQVGSGFVGVQISAGNRIGNHCQISRKDIVTTRRANLVKKVGRQDELGYQIAKAGRELQRDVEAALLANNNAVQGNTTTAGQSASYNSWIRANSARATTGSGADPAALVAGFPTGAAAVDGTPLAVSESVGTGRGGALSFLGVIGSCYIAGGNIDTVLMHPSMKQKFSQYMMNPGTSNTGRIATPFQDHGKSPTKGAQVLGAVDLYVSDFGVIQVIPDRFQRSRDIPVFESQMWAVAYLDPYQQFDIAKTGDSEKRVMLVDWTLEARNPDGCGILADGDAAAPWVA